MTLSPEIFIPIILQRETRTFNTISRRTAEKNRGTNSGAIGFLPPKVQAWYNSS